MSVISWVENEVKKIEADFESVETEVEKVILPAAIAIVNVAKTIVIDDSTDILGTLVDGAAGAGLEYKARTVLPLVYAKLQLAETFLAANPTTDTLIADVTKIGLTLVGDARTSYLIELAGKIATALSDEKLTVQQGLVLTQAFYAEETGTATAAQAAELAPAETPEFPIEGKAAEEAAAPTE